MAKADWLEVWIDDWESLIETQNRNIQSELQAGFKWTGQHVQHEVKILKEFDSKYRDGLEKFKYMDEREVQRWCYFDLLKRGAITR